MIAGAFAFLLGCGGSDVPKSVPVSGKITLDGAPLTQGNISFVPTVEGKHSSAGSIDAQGNYKMSTTGTTGDGKAGVPPGKYKVVIITEFPMMMPSADSTPIKIDSKFTSAATTPLSVEVKEGAAPGTYDFTVTK